MTRTLFTENLDIHRSKIATEANRAIDVFYVRDKANLVKITDPERMTRLKSTLLDLLADG
jgi:UTP:GlnB (protein PII) uridylyltransferase